MDASKYGDYIRKLEFLEKRKKDPKEEALEIREKKIKVMLMIDVNLRVNRLKS